MKIDLLLAASMLALASFSSSAIAEQMNMPGMTMPRAAKKAHSKKPGTKKRGPQSTSAKRMSEAKERVTRSLPTKKAVSPELQSTKGMAMPTGEGSTMPMPAKSAPGPTPMPAMKMPAGSTSPGQMPMQHAHSMSSGALGPYAGQRESSGTAWQPDSSQAMSGPMLMSGDWMLMAHGTMNLVLDHQSGRRGNDKAFASGMLMGMARHPLGNGTVQLRAMVSPDPLMGPAGYPLLLASGETANGRTPLVDRQHPHDFFMELSASLSQNIGTNGSVFLYAGLPGEPAFGPPAFMHREAILDSPEAPITHHWLDSTHITYGVVTAGVVMGRLKLEASRFNAREPDQHRWNIETGPLDSTSVRVSWNPTRTLALQGSWGHFRDPEQLEPGVNQTRWSASALWARDLAPDWHAAATLAWGRKSSQGHNDDAIAAEGSLRHAGWTIFGRGEWIENRELLGLVDSQAYKVGKVSVGAVRDFRVADHLSLGAGGLFSINFVPGALAPLYGSHEPTGAMAFVRLKLN